MPVTIALQQIPEEFRESIAGHWQDFCRQAQAENIVVPSNTETLQALFKVWVCSDFFLQKSLREPAVCSELIDSGDLLRQYQSAELADLLHSAMTGISDEVVLMQVLRQFRDREMMRIAWRDLMVWADVKETLRDLSDLADACIREALGYLYRHLCKSEGVPRNAEGREQHLLILGMGKLGAGELNFSSDIDLIFAFQDGGRIRGRGKISCDVFFTTLGRQLIRVLNDTTVDGFVYRVDMRLRPYGSSGPLVMSFDALEEYYQYQGREWERYAMIKARPITGDFIEQDQLTALLHPFIYRRYLDFNVLEAVRDLKSQIERKVYSKGMEDNIKLGPGGIREIEFIVQSFQLLRGGQDQELQQRNLLKVLQRMEERGLLPDMGEQIYTLAQAYLFLRRTENHIQEFEDAQTHDLPVGELDRLRLAWSMGYAGWDLFVADLDQIRAFVTACFVAVIASSEGKTEEGSVTTSLSDVWGNQLNEAAALAVLINAGFDDADEVFRVLIQLREGMARRVMGNQGREQLDRLMPLLLTELVNSEHDGDTLMRLIHLLEAIVGRSVYLTLLIENPQALTQLIRLCSASPWIASQLVLHPLLLDELLDPCALYAPQRYQALLEELEQRFVGIDDTDLEWQMEALRQFRQGAVLRVAAADIAGAIPLMVVSDYLTEIADVILHKVLELALMQQSVSSKKVYADDFAIIAYGKMGGIELGYGSDLDLVFLHDQTKGERRDAWFARLGQRIIHLLNTLTPSGVLYEVDMRLRPSGESGLLVSGLQSFSEYQEQEAWTWEHQALVRARVIAGSERIATGFSKVRNRILARRRGKKDLQQDIAVMRRRMLQEFGCKRAGKFDIKRDSGGITDIEFMVQYGVLLWSHNHPELLQYTDNINLLEQLALAGKLAKKDAVFLGDVYRSYRSRVHQLTLMEESSVVDEDEFSDLRQGVIRIWDKIFN
ncbi:MAG: bifunctional [glutamate--ammonia ligase]-adenylyl-L-tyrosine phosphorylase/[glutamate--ammonia-ligase] adenylyltransferase [Gammaproteobacteria bacterium]|nr:bifunctional [glutamate--ammonia ligase]-adenylyl-L-tyrosine phosphorylase/[glutamate--ammonia-ligase] adenylyltransferase [Gammaproteobacteria bacterium]